MDLLYSRYASPMELIDLYINQGRFGEFVSGVLELDFKRRKEEAEKDNEWKLWTMYIHSMSNKNFLEWKEEVSQKQEPVSYAMTNEEVAEVKEQAKGILKRISPV